ncbi:uncharacterized protein [Coffea arabica]|uniref:Uncharacterized protein n=1 Tax=Coffea arabica TaxID=13443 RepID=A0A6P6SN59_COFAR|nr:uncharacterized protein LOC113692932 [Coffea arabica]
MDDDTKNKTPHLQDDHHQLAAAETEEADEALSLSGLILNSDEIEVQDRRRSSFSDPSELFEFLSDKNSQMSHAEDIIFCGKLMPYQENPSRLPNAHNFHKHHQLTRHEKQQSFHRRRSESLSDLKTSLSNSARRNQHQFMRASRSLDCRKLYGNKYNSPSAAGGFARAEKVEIERSSSTRSSNKGFNATGMKEKTARPRWYMMFGPVRFPPEMAYQDIKSRQVRQSPGSLFTSLESREKAIVNRPQDRRWSGSWDLLRVLSCKGHASVAVTASFGCLQAQHSI